MTKVVVDVPVPGIKNGDVRRMTRHPDGGSLDLIVHTSHVRAEGPWTCVGDKVEATYTHCTFMLVVQEGTRVGGAKVRPGTIVSGAFTLDVLETAELVPWDKPIIGPDTEENIDARWKSWEETSK